jgi:nitrite reductase (NO-forming)
MTSAWLVAALVVMVVGLVARGALPQPLWTMIHVVTLGVLSNAILQWSWYFARALLHLPAGDRHAGRGAVLRSVAFNVSLVGLVAAMWTGSTWGTVAGAGAIGAVIAWHGLAMVQAARTRLASRFAVVIRYYVAAAAFLVVGCVFAGFVTVAMFAQGAPAWLLAARDDVTLAHALVNVGGWVGLSMAGTLVTLGPTMLRTRMDPAAVTGAVRALPWLAGGIVVAATAACLGWMPGIALGLLIFAGALGVGIVVPLVRVALDKAPRTYATWTTTAGLAWVVVGLVAVAAGAFTAPDATALRTHDLSWLPILGAGGLAQVFIGALTYLMPVAIGGGPEASRVGMAVLETAWPLRVTVRNAALLLVTVSLAADSGLGTLWWAVVLACFAADVVAFSLAGVKQARARRALAATADATTRPDRTPPAPLPRTRQLGTNTAVLPAVLDANSRLRGEGDGIFMSGDDDE